VTTKLFGIIAKTYKKGSRQKDRLLNLNYKWGERGEKRGGALHLTLLIEKRRELGEGVSSKTISAEKKNR